MSDPQAEMQVVVFKSRKMADTYVYVPLESDFDELPEAFRERFGKPHRVVEFSLHAQRYLAQADAVAVLAAIDRQGFYLQLPPGEQP